MELYSRKMIYHLNPKEITKTGSKKNQVYKGSKKNGSFQLRNNMFKVLNYHRILAEIFKQLTVT